MPIFGALVCLTIAPKIYSSVSTLTYDKSLCSAELLVVKKDFANFISDATSERHKEGIRKRILGSFPTLKWICRANINNNIDASAFDLLPKLFADNKLKELENGLSALSKRYLFNASVYLDFKLTQKEVKEGGAIHDFYCKSCHENAQSMSEMPLQSLRLMAQTLDSKEFIARMVLGVKGTSVIALRNPLKRKNFASMYRYLLSSKSK